LTIFIIFFLTFHWDFLAGGPHLFLVLNPCFFGYTSWLRCCLDIAWAAWVAWCRHILGLSVIRRWYLSHTHLEWSWLYMALHGFRTNLSFLS
jgi:hypothetical protein